MSLKIDSLYIEFRRADRRPAKARQQACLSKMLARGRRRVLRGELEATAHRCRPCDVLGARQELEDEPELVELAVVDAAIRATPRFRRHSALEVRWRSPADAGRENSIVEALRRRMSNGRKEQLRVLLYVCTCPCRRIRRRSGWWPPHWFR